MIVDPYTDLADVFSKVKATKLPPHCPWECANNLLAGTVPVTWGRTYPLSLPEIIAMDYINEWLAQGYIHISSSRILPFERKRWWTPHKIEGLCAVVVKYHYPPFSSSLCPGTGKRSCSRHSPAVGWTQTMKTVRGWTKLIYLQQGCLEVEDVKGRWMVSSWGAVSVGRDAAGWCFGSSRGAVMANGPWVFQGDARVVGVEGACLQSCCLRAKKESASVLALHTITLTCVWEQHPFILSALLLEGECVC